MSYGEDLIAMVDQRIGLATKKEKATGTVVARDSTGPGAMVIFDGATTAMPVKVLGNVFTREGTRVVLEKFGSDWLVIGAFIGYGLGEASKRFNHSVSTGGVNSTSFTDITDFGTIDFTKFHDRTFIRCGVLWQGFANAVTTGVEFGIRMTQLEGEGYTAADHAVGRCFMNASGDHQGTYSMVRMTGIPAGTYRVSYRVRRYTGAGTIYSDQNDQTLLEMDEQVRSGVPIL